jgi:protoporphyrinogen oxidase
MFGYVDGGYATILDRFQKGLDGLGVHTLYQRPVTEVRDGNAHVKVATSKGEMLEFDHVILTLPCSKLPEVCPQLSEDEKRRFEKVIYEGVICATLVLKKALAGYYVTNLTDGWVPFTGVIEMTAVVDRAYFGGNSLVYLPRYVSAEDQFLKKEDKEIQEEFVAALERIYPQFKREDIVATKIIRGKNVLPITTLNYSKEVLPPVRTSLKHVFVVNSAQIVNGTMNVNEIVGLANKKAREIVQVVGGERLEV